MAKFIYDEKEIFKARLELPFASPGGRTSGEAMIKPGNCVKSKELASPRGFPKQFGRVVKFSKEEVVIINHNDGFSEPFLWRGTSSEYFNCWDCD